MCYVKEVKTSYRKGPTETHDEVHLCANSINGQTCENTVYETERKRAPGSDSQLGLPSSSSSSSSSTRNNGLVLHQDTMPIRERPREERRYSSEIGVKFRGLFKSPEYYIKRLDGEGSHGRRDGHDPRRSRVLLPEVPEPPTRVENRRSPPPSILSIHGGSPTRPTPPQGPGGVVAFTTRETAPSSPGTLSRASSSRSRDAHRAVVSLPHLTVPVNTSPAPSHTSRHTTPGLSRISFALNTRFRDSAYGSSNISPIDAPKPESITSETRSTTTTSGRSANEKYNYTNDHLVVRKGKEVYRDDHDDDDDEISNSSEGRKSHRIVRRVLGENNDPEETGRRMQEDMRAAIEHQSQTSEYGEGSVRSRSGSGQRRRHRRRHGSDE